MLRIVPAFSGIVALVLVALALFANGHAQTASLLENGEFENWSGGIPDSWSVIGSVSPQAWPGGGGQAALLSGSAGLSQFVAAVPGRTYTAEVLTTLASGSGDAALRLSFVDGGLLPVGAATIDSIAAGGTIESLQAVAIAPPGAALVEVRLQATANSPDGALLFDAASLTEQSDADPTQTPTLTPTPEDPPTPTRSPTPSGNGLPGGGSSGVPDPENGSAPALLPPSGDVLTNGRFDAGNSDGPMAWDKFGGILFWSPNGGSGDGGSAALISLTTSTKWAFQLVPIQPGQWYEGSANARITAGKAETWMSVLWYASADGSGVNIAEDTSEQISSNTWEVLSLGPVRAPAGARSARFRLMVQAAFPAAVSFDDATFHLVEPPADERVAGELSDSAPPDSSAAGPRPAASTQESPTVARTTRAPVATPRPPRTGSRTAVRSCDVCLTEVMSDPAVEGRDASFEWIELQNLSQQPVALEGWMVGDSSSTDMLSNGLSISPGGYLVIAGTEATFGGGVQVIRVEDGAIGGGLNNDEDVVRLVRPDASLADSVSYGPTGDLPAATRGRSLAYDDDNKTWIVASQPSAGGITAEETLPASNVAPVTFEPEPAPSRIPWIILGICVATGVFAAPFAVQRLRAGLAHANIGHGR